MARRIQLSAYRFYKPLSDVFSDETVDSALGGSVRLVQPKKGYRFSLDAVLLARFSAEKKAVDVLDLGCGCGVVGLSILTLGGASGLTGIDFQKEMVRLASKSAFLNGFKETASFIAGDLRGIKKLLPRKKFGMVVSNPPYRPAASGRLNAIKSSAIARHELKCTIDDVVAAAGHALESRGEFCVVYPAQRLPVLICACLKNNLTPKELRFAHPKKNEKASLAFLRCVKNSGEGLAVSPPWILHSDGGGYSAEAMSLLGPP